MTRRALISIIALSIVLVGYQPSFGMTKAVAAQAEMSSSMDGDCAKKSADDCCEESNSSDKSKCLFDDACMARCHVNAGLEPASLYVSVHLTHTAVLSYAEPPPLHAPRAGPLYRPPIL